MSMGKKATTVNTKKKSSLQLKGRIFMQNVTDIVWTAKNGKRLPTLSCVQDLCVIKETIPCKFSGKGILGLRTS